MNTLFFRTIISASILLSGLTPMVVLAQESTQSSAISTNPSVDITSGSTQKLVTTNSNSCPLIGRSLRVGSSGDDVFRLQQYLAQDSAVYPEGTVSGYFGLRTQAAVRRWQIKYNIVASGSPSTTGFGMVGPRTAAAISLQCTQQTTQTNGTEVGGYIQVSPVAGAAPLPVSVQAIVNTTNNCTATTYTLDFGDGTQYQQIPTNGSCTQVTQNYSHTYTQGGSYQIILSNGSHRTSAVVNVSGVSPQQPSPQLPADSVRPSITSGTVPLTVVFSGTVSSASGSGCQGVCNETLNFGDGTIGLIALPTTLGTWQSYTINHTYASAGTYIAALQSVSGATIGSTMTIIVGAQAVVTPQSGSYGILSITPNSTNTSTAALSISIPSCSSYVVDWGDGVVSTNATGACTSGGSTVSMSHTYSTKGSFTISLKDGSGNVQTTSSYIIN